MGVKAILVKDPGHQSIDLCHKIRPRPFYFIAAEATVVWIGLPYND